MSAPVLTVTLRPTVHLYWLDSDGFGSDGPSAPVVSVLYGRHVLNLDAARQAQFRYLDMELGFLRGEMAHELRRDGTHLASALQVAASKLLIASGRWPR